MKVERRKGRFYDNRRNREGTDSPRYQEGRSLRQASLISKQKGEHRPWGSRC